ncbi:MAG: TQO small subunit DoxD [Terriglobales bacterium]
MMSEQETRFLFAVALLTIAAGALLLAGYLTRWAALVAIGAGVSTMCSWLPAPNVALFDTTTVAALATAIAAAVICLGPGAFSLDARFFGRREIIIPRIPHNT